MAQHVEAGTGCSDNRVHRHSEQRAEFCRVHLDAAFLCGVVHRQGDDRRQLEFDELLHQKQPLVEIGRVQHRENAVWRLGAFHAAEDHIDRDFFLERVRTQ